MNKKAKRYITHMGDFSMETLPFIIHPDFACVQAWLVRGIKVYRPYLGEYATSMEMAGASVSLLRLDAELKALLDAPDWTPFVQQV